MAVVATLSLSNQSNSLPSGSPGSSRKLDLILSLFNQGALAVSVTSISPAIGPPNAGILGPSFDTPPNVSAGGGVGAQSLGTIAPGATLSFPFSVSIQGMPVVNPLPAAPSLVATVGAIIQFSDGSAAVAPAVSIAVTSQMQFEVKGVEGVSTGAGVFPEQPGASHTDGLQHGELRAESNLMSGVLFAAGVLGI